MTSEINKYGNQYGVSGFDLIYPIQYIQLEIMA